MDFQKKSIRRNQRSKTVDSFGAGTGFILSELSLKWINQRGDTEKKQDMEIREKLRLLRRSAGYTQEFIADAISADPVFVDSEKTFGQKRVSHIENLQSHVYEHELCAWCKALHITVAELYAENIGHLTEVMLDRMQSEG
jgi:hypothetical protein